MADTHPDAASCLPALRRGEDAFAADLTARLGSHLKQAEQALIAAKSEALRPFELSVAQYAVLVALYYMPGQSSAQLARSAAVTPQTMSSILAKLEDKRLVERTPSKLHAKVLVTRLSPDGEALVLRADEEARAVEQRLSDAFTEDERSQLRALLSRATSALRDSESEHVS